MAQQSLAILNEIIPVIRPAQAWPYASAQHSGRIGATAPTNQITADKAPGIQSPLLSWLTSCTTTVEY